MEKGKSYEMARRMFNRNRKALDRLKSKFEEATKRIQKQNSLLSHLYERKQGIENMDDLEFRAFMLSQKPFSEDPVYSKLKNILEEQARYVGEERDYLQKKLGETPSLIQIMQNEFFIKFLEDFIKRFPQRKVSGEEYTRFLEYASENQLLRNELARFQDSAWFNLEEMTLRSHQANNYLSLSDSDNLAQEAIKNLDREGHFNLTIGVSYWVDTGSDDWGSFGDGFYFGNKGTAEEFFYRCWNQEKQDCWNSRLVLACIRLTSREFFDLGKPVSIRLQKGKIESGGQKTQPLLSDI